jgi:hypothetical protein
VASNGEPSGREHVLLTSSSLTMTAGTRFLRLRRTGLLSPWGRPKVDRGRRTRRALLTGIRSPVLAEAPQAWAALHLQALLIN